MTHEITYNGEAEGLTVTQISNLISVVSDWASGSADRKLNRVTAYPESGTCEILVTQSNVKNIKQTISDLDSDIESLNKDLGFDLPLASECVSARSE